MSVMYILGNHLFGSDTHLPKQVDRSTSYDWQSQKRLGRTPAQQAISLGEDGFTMNGVMFPCSTNKELSPKQLLSNLRQDAASMHPMNLVDGEGYVYGRWVVKKIDEKRSQLWANSDPRKIEFSITMSYYGEDNEVSYAQVV